MTDLKSLALHYYNLGLNITCIKNEITNSNYNKSNLLKNPYHDYSEFIDRRQTIDELLDLDWQNACGIGAIAGFKKLRVLDIDGCNHYEFVKDLLKILNLPDDYEWVIKSGSRNGYHIYFYTDENDDENKNFFESDKINYFYEKYGKKGLPFLKYENSEFYTATFYPNIDNSALFERIDFMWKSNVILPYSYHKSTYRYSFVNNTPCNSPLKINHKKLFTIVNCFLLHEYYESYFPIVFDANIDLDKNNSLKNLRFIFDIETDGLITGINYPAILQISWAIMDDENKILKKNTEIIKADFNRNSDALKINNLDIETLEKFGKDEFYVLNSILNDIKKCSEIYSHNLDFDLTVLIERLKKHHIEFNFDLKRKICTMKEGTKLFITENNKSPKYPTLTELFEKLYNYKINQTHNAQSDVSILIKCIKKMKNTKII